MINRQVFVLNTLFFFFYSVLYFCYQPLRVKNRQTLILILKGKFLFPPFLIITTCSEINRRFFLDQSWLCWVTCPFLFTEQTCGSNFCFHLFPIIGWSGYEHPVKLLYISLPNVPFMLSQMAHFLSHSQGKRILPAHRSLATGRRLYTISALSGLPSAPQLSAEDLETFPYLSPQMSQHQAADIGDLRVGFHQETWAVFSVCVPVNGSF